MTDINTLNEMYIANDCRLPDNVVCVPSPRSDECLLVNREPEPLPVRLETSGVAAFLHNLEADRRLTASPSLRTWFRLEPSGNCPQNAGPEAHLQAFRPVAPGQRSLF